MDATFIDNRTHILKDDLAQNLRQGDRISVAASVFSMYAYNELREQLEGLDEFRFIYTEPTFAKDRAKKEQREFYIPRLSREQGLYGTEFEIRLRNELTQKAVAGECARWIRKHATFKSPKSGTATVTPALTLQSQNDTASYMPLMSGFTVGQLGVGDHPVLTGIQRSDTQSSRMFLNLFNQVWESGELEDVTSTVIENIEQMYRENPPELVYYAALYRIFHEFLDDISADNLPKEGSGFRESKIWNLLYDFQRDAVLAIINKLQTYDGCILADSVGLGKTFTALAVIKYYESLNRNVLVLCPKKLSDNWTTYRNNQRNNPIAEDRLRYDVMYHTDLSRKRGRTVTGIDLEAFNWGGYDLVVIDESHNFRNGEDSARASKGDESDGIENRYQRLLNRVLRGGVPTKVLMLSATPVNNRFRDLRNQLALAYQGDPQGWSERLGLTSNVEDVFRRAQGSFKMWSDLPAEERTTEALTESLDFDFFRVLDQVTVARSRRHIQRYYDVNAIGPFPERQKPISVYPKLSTLENGPTYSEIADSLNLLNLAVYVPSQYLLASAVCKYENENGNLTTRGRETGVRRLMAANLLKRLESSVSSFRLTLERVHANMATCLSTIEAFKAAGAGSVDVSGLTESFDFDADDAEEMDFSVGGKVQYDLRDLDWKTWERDVRDDAQTIEGLLAMIEGIDAEHDAKLLDLEDLIAKKTVKPLNPGNKKVIIFTAFADTADYLYEHLASFAQKRLGLATAEVTGASGSKTAVPGVRNDLSEILTCFSPVSKERDKVFPRLTGKDIDILIATDCISEGQNLQDADYLVNYDIHWNPVRIVQRFGRVDRIGSKNNVIQLVNFWPDEDLDHYINLKARVENRMHAVVMSSTGDDDYINEGEKGDLEYRRQQLEQMQHDVVDLEDVSGGVSITDLGLNDFRMDLVSYYQENPDIDRVPTGIDAVVEGDEPGIAFVLRNVSQELDAKTRNAIHPFYLVYVSNDGEVVRGYLDPKDTLDAMRRLCRGKSEPDAALCRAYNKATKNGRDMRAASSLLRNAIESIVDKKAEEDLASFFTAGTTSFLENDIAGLDDFELICFLVVMPRG